MNPSGKLAILLVFGVVSWAILPVPAGLTSTDWALLILFLVTIAGVVWHPYPIGVMILLSLSLGACLKLLTMGQALAGYSNAVTWIIVSAFMFARAFIKTGLGRRIALSFIQRLGSSSLRLGYAVSFSDLVLAPVTASNTARTGGIIFPIVRSLAGEFRSEPGPTARDIGSYLLFTAFQANIVTSAMFLTAMAANGVSTSLARSTAGVSITWGLWLYASFLPATLSLLITPYLIYRCYPPRLKSTPEARHYATEELRRLGPMSRHEKVLVLVFVVVALAWATSNLHGVSTVAVALLAVSTLLIAGVLDLRDVSQERSAWETYIWFGGIVSIAGALSDSRLIPWFVEQTTGLFAGVSNMTALLILVVLYVYLHYAFASMTSQIIALYAAFLGIAVAAGAPPLLSALLLCFFSNLYASLTHYGDGAAPIYYGAGYIEQGDWWRVGFYLSLLHLGIWLGIGLPWWKLLGIW